MIGDYRSMIICSSNIATEVYPSVDPSSIALYFDYKFGATNTTLIQDNGSPIIGTNKQPIICDRS